MRDEKIIGLLNSWLASHPKRSINALAKKVNLCEMTLRRIHQGETAPTLQTSLNLLPHIASPEQQKAYIEVRFPSAFEQLRLNTQDSPRLLDNKTSEYLQDPTMMKIIALAFCNRGTSLKVIEDNFGLEGVRKTQSLVHSGVIHRNSDYISGKGSLIMSPQSTKNQGISFFTSFDLSNLGKPQCVLSSHTESLSEPAVQRIKDILKRAIEEITDIRMNPENFGDNLICFTVGLNSLIERK